MGYTWLAVALGVAGVGISLCFPTVANAVVGSVPPADIGIASGTNSALREIGVYTSPSTFVDHFKDAVWLGAAFSAVGILAAAALPLDKSVEEVGDRAFQKLPVEDVVDLLVVERDHAGDG
jgi:hypothetical protein